MTGNSSGRRTGDVAIACGRLRSRSIAHFRLKIALRG